MIVVVVVVVVVVARPSSKLSGLSKLSPSLCQEQRRMQQDDLSRL
jgi:hypothetical protein